MHTVYCITGKCKFYCGYKQKTNTAAFSRSDDQLVSDPFSMGDFPEASRCAERGESRLLRWRGLLITTTPDFYNRKLERGRRRKSNCENLKKQEQQKRQSQRLKRIASVKFADRIYERARNSPKSIRMPYYNIICSKLVPFAASGSGLDKGCISW